LSRGITIILELNKLVNNQVLYNIVEI